MPSFTDIGDGPAILKLAKWDHLPCHLKPSELSEVSLSPTKKLLLLLSCQSEALLLPLTGLQCSYSLKEDASRFCHSDQSLIPNKFTEHLSSAPASKINSAESFEDSCEVSSASFGSCTLISNVKTFAWGHYGDSYSHFKQSDFKEFFIVCSDNGIIFHSFRYLNKEYQEHSFFKESGPFTGHWVQWGPSSDIRTEEQFSNIHEYEQKRWLQTFHTELDASWHGRKYLARFPMKSSYPQSAAVLSFDIKHATLNFLDSCHTTHPLDETKLDFEIPVSAVLSPQLPSSQANLHSAGSHIGCSYKFIRVFSGSLHNQLGFVLTCAEHKAVENELQNCGHTVAVIIMLHHWGLEWLCSIKLENSLPGPGSDWADFQILENLLVCLGTSGLISIWCTKTGNPIVSIDIVRSCQANENAPSWLNELKISGIDSSRNEIMRNFRNLMVAPNSLLLAASDEHGVIYVIDANNYISEHQPNKIVSLSQPSELGVLGNWNVAGKGIGCQKVFAYVSNNLCFNALESSYGNLPNHKHNIVFRHGKRLRKHNIDKENFLDGYRDGFNNLSQRNTHLETCYSKKESISISKLRRIHLPPNHHSTNDPVCFSLFGVTRLIGYYAMTGEKLYNFSHTDLHVSSTFVDDRNLNDFWWYKRCCFKKDIFAGESFGFSFKGFLYAVTQEGLFVILPSASFTCSQPSVESARHCQPSAACRTHLMNYSLAVNDPPAIWKPWQMEVFDKTLFFEGSEEAEAICSNNGWDLRIARLRRMQLGLHYLKFDEINESLDMLADANLAEEGILHLLFTAAHMLFCKYGNDNEVSLASRLLDMAACFATKIIRKYGSAEYMKPQFLSCCEDFGSSYIWKHQHYPKRYESSNSHRLSEMALLLEGIRNIQNQLGSKDRRVLLDKRDGRDMNDMVDGEILQNSMPPITSNDPVSLIMSDFVESQPHTSALHYNENEDLTSSANSNLVNCNAICVPEANPNARNKLLALENPKETIIRWKLDSLDLNSVVKEALLSGRLPLAVLQVHLQRYGDQMDEKQHFDNFAEVCDIGRAIAYELFAKGESALALETLLRLGEDIELILMQLLFGTVRRSLRAEIAKEMESYGYLGRHERKILERISLIERLYPSSSFWLTYHWKLKDGTPSNINQEISKKELKFVMHDNLVIECGDIDGVILGSWANLDDDPAFLVVDEEKVHTGYWACAATWADAWDQLTIDRVLLDRPNNAGVVTSWESQLEFHLSHHNFKDVYKLFEVIPPYLLSEEILRINLNYSNFCSENEVKTQHHSLDICTPGEVDPVCLNFPKIKILRFSAVHMCSSWLKMLVEQELAKKYIFLRDHWDSIAELIHLFGCAGLIIKASKISDNSKLSCSSQDLAAEKFCEPAHNDILEALHRLTLCYCIQYNLPHFLNLYLDHHNVALDDTTLCTLREAAGDCQWAKWLLCLRMKGYEYEASFLNARSNLFKQIAHANKLNINEDAEIIHTIDDLAEGGGELVALATLMHESSSIQNFLCSGIVNRQCTSSSQCTLENLKPGLGKFPTLWKTLVSACFGTYSNEFSESMSSFFGKSAFSDYLRFRERVFSSVAGDTSLVQMLPCWFPKSVRRLVRLFAQVPLRWQSLTNVLNCGASFLYQESTYFLDANVDEINPLSWEAAIQESIKKELYSSLEVDNSSIEQHLHRGHAFSAFSHLLSLRSSEHEIVCGHHEPMWQANIQSDVQALLSHLSGKELSFLPSVIQLAVMHFDDSALVASCTFFLELCGIPTSMLRIDIAALLRIADYLPSIKQNIHNDVSPTSSSIHVESHRDDINYFLAQALADNYIHHEIMALKQKEAHVNTVSRGNKLLQPLLIVLQHLEKASLPPLDEGNSCGFWLSTGVGDGFEFRSHQKNTSQHWKLVTDFCQIHNLPLSTKYLAFLANDNDWVGFLMEAQISLLPVDTVIKVAAKEFTNPQLKTHILTILKSMQSMRKYHGTSASTSLGSNYIVAATNESDTRVPAELFELIAICERKQYPGEALLLKAKDLRWSLLAMVASCFPDVSPLSCLTVWLEITAARETSLIKVNDISSKIAENVKAAVESTNALPSECRTLSFHYNRRNSKRRKLLDASSDSYPLDSSNIPPLASMTVAEETVFNELETSTILEVPNVTDLDGVRPSLSNMVVVLCEQRLFLPLLRAFELFLPSCALLPFIRSLQAFSQLRLSEASVHLSSFSIRLKDESLYLMPNIQRDGILKSSWISSTAAKAAEAILSTCPSAYEKVCLLKLLAATDFGDGGSTSTYFQRLHWKINLAEPSLRKVEDLHLGNETLDDGSLLAALENNGRWDQARNWARQLESTSTYLKQAAHHVTETQAEAMVTEWKEFLWDVPEERAALWIHCHTLFVRHSFPSLQAGIFFLRHANAVEKEIPAKELHDMLLFSLQWLSGYITQSPPVYPLHFLREIETRVWLLAVESEAQAKTKIIYNLPSSIHSLDGGNKTSIIDQTATIIEKMDGHVNATCTKVSAWNGLKECCVQLNHSNQASDSTNSNSIPCSTRVKRRTKNYPALKKPLDNMDMNNDSDDSPKSPQNMSSGSEIPKNSQLQEEKGIFEVSISGWEAKVNSGDIEKAILSLLECGQVTAAKQLQHKLSPLHVPSELAIVDAALKIASLTSSSKNEGISESLMNDQVLSLMQSCDILFSNHVINPLQVLESLSLKCGEGCGRGLCWRIIAVVKAAKALGLTFSEAFEKRPIELLQLLSLKAQDSLEQAKLLVQTHFIPPSSVAKILSESFLKGLLAAHRGGFIDSQKEEGPAPLLWRFSDFLKWAELCPSEPEIGHSLMRLVMTGQDIPHACEVELLILSHHFYESSACLDGVDVLVTLAANRVESYVSEGDFSCLARLVTGVSNFHALNFILNILIENGQLELLLSKYTTPDTAAGSSESIRGFRMAVLTSLKIFNPHDLDSFAMAYSHFDMKHETASLLESRSLQHMQRWLSLPNRDRQTGELLEAMRFLNESAREFSTIDAGHKSRRACAQAALLFLQIRIPDLTWIDLSETNARRVLVEQSRFQVALIVAEAYGLNQPAEWAPVLWNQMLLRPDLLNEFVAEFVLVLPLHSSMLLELARFYRAEVAARVDQSHFSAWLSPAGLPAEWVRHLGKSFRGLLRRTGDLRLRVQLAAIATGFEDVVNVCMKLLDKVPDNAGPLVLRRGHGGAYVAIM